MVHSETFCIIYKTKVIKYSIESELNITSLPIPGKRFMAGTSVYNSSCLA